MNKKGFTLIEFKIVIAIIAILAAVVVPNFLNARNRARLAAAGQLTEQDIPTYAGVKVADYKNGVYYFDACEAKFAKALSDFKAKNPSLRITAIAPNDRGGSGGYTTGYFVNCEDPR